MDTPKRKPTPTSGAGNGQGRKPKWKHTPTTAIRVPEHIAPQLLEVAKYLDNLDDFVQKPEKLRTMLVTYESQERKVQRVITLTENDWTLAEKAADKVYEELISQLPERQAQQLVVRLWEEIL